MIVRLQLAPSVLEALSRSAAARNISVAALGAIAIERQLMRVGLLRGVGGDDSGPYDIVPVEGPVDHWGFLSPDRGAA